MFASDDERTTKRYFSVHPPLRDPVRAQSDAHRVSRQSRAMRGGAVTTLTPFLSTVWTVSDKSGQPPERTDARRQTIEQTQPLGAAAAPRAYEPRPKAAARKAHNSDADSVFVAVAIAEPDERCCGISPDVAVAPPKSTQERPADHRPSASWARELTLLDTCV